MKKRDNKKFLNEVERRLKRRYSKEMRTSLEFASPFELLISTILSAQTTDRQVNIVTKRLFKEYGTAKIMASANPAKVRNYIKSIGLYRNKAKNIIAASKCLVDNYEGMVPRSIEKLVKIPGVGRKTANVVLSNAYHINEGIAIDTHCITVSNRLGIAKTPDPKRIEADMMEYIDRKEWNNISHLFIALGRDACTARVKYCDRCVLNDICPSSTVVK
ncbi:Endonuclease III/Nth [mine drainage metagenome]|uniref:Endonuclease III/Nth n=1 Tax=mine drainage metagenome TaxID=410659 RepID=T0ZFP7_9ZZZZ